MSLTTMYTGKINSPSTTLDGAINDSVTTINVVDGSVFPDAPNIAVMGTGEDAETILYDAKAGNELSSVTRGFQGTAKAWDSGTSIARLFTAYDYDTLRGNINDLAGVISNKTGSGALVFGTSPTVVLPTVKGTSASDLPTYSAEFLDADNWTSTGWTGDWATGWTHSTGNVTALSHDHNASTGTKYQIAWTVTGRTAGTFTVSFGGQSLGGQSATGTFGPTATTTDVLSITPTTDFDGTIDISIKSITGVSTPVEVYESSEGTTRLEIRANTGSSNTFVGEGAGAYNTTGNQNTFNGHQAGRSNTTGNNNTFNGHQAGYSNTTGNQNTFNGHQAGYSNTTGNQNTFNGYAAGRSNTTGYNNTFNGYQAGYSNTTGYQNTFNGYRAGYSNTTGNNNTFNGYAAGRSNTTGNNNTFNGYQAGRYQSDGSTALETPENSIYIGSNSKGYDNDDNNTIVIGYNAIGLGANTIVFGNDSITQTHLKGKVMIGLNSDTPTARLHLPAGTATASTAPLKFTTGTLNTTPEAGAMEYSSNELYFTRNATREKILTEGHSVDDLSDVDLTSPAAGDIMYFDGDDWINLAKGTAGQVLTMNAGGTAPEWADIPE